MKVGRKTGPGVGIILVWSENFAGSPIIPVFIKIYIPGIRRKPRPKEYHPFSTPLLSDLVGHSRLEFASIFREDVLNGTFTEPTVDLTPQVLNNIKERF